MADTRLWDAASSILTRLNEVMTNEGISMPSRQYVHSGDIAHDLAAENCADAFIVSWTLLSQGSVGAGAGLAQNAPIRCAMPTVAQMTIALLRCVPTLDESFNAPSATALNDSAEQILTDTMTLTTATIEESLRKTLTGIGCTLNAITSLTPVGPFGGVGGTALTILVGLV